MMDMEKATYVNLERTFSYYDLETIEQSLLGMSIKQNTEIEELIKRRDSTLKSLKRVQDKLKEFQDSENKRE